MASVCGGLTQSPYSGNICDPGFIAGMIMFEELPTAITEANAAVKATWETLLKANQPDRGYLIMFKNIEPAEPEIIKESYSDGTEAIVTTKFGINRYEVLASNTGKRTLYADFKTGRTMYCYPIYINGAVGGKEVTVGTIEAVKQTVYTSLKPATPDSREKIVIFVQDEEDWAKYANSVDPGTAFDFSALLSVQMMTFTLGAITTTSITLVAKNLDKVGITDLSRTGAGFFTVHNDTDPADVTVTGITGTGSTYILGFAAQTSADAFTVGYGEPVTSSEYYDLSATVSSVFP